MLSQVSLWRLHRQIRDNALHICMYALKLIFTRASLSYINLSNCFILKCYFIEKMFLKNGLGELVFALYGTGANTGTRMWTIILKQKKSMWISILLTIYEKLIYSPFVFLVKVWKWNKKVTKKKSMSLSCSWIIMHNPFKRLRISDISDKIWWGLIWFPKLAVLVLEKKIDV